MAQGSSGLSDESMLTRSLAEISSNCQKIISEATKLAEADIDKFVSKDVGRLFKLVSIYKDTYERLGVSNRAELEQKISKLFRSRRVRENFDEVLDSEQAWDEFLLGVDGKLACSDLKPLVFGDPGPTNCSVIDARTGKSELTELGARVLIVSFGELEGAERWLAETACPFDMVLDPPRNIYQAFGLYRSVYKVWSVSCLTYYAEQIVAGRQLPKPYENVHDDPNQMGGDFILDEQGKVIMSHPSKAATDRPTVVQLLLSMRNSRSLAKSVCSNNGQ